MPFLFCFCDGKNLKTPSEKKTKTGVLKQIKVKFKLIIDEKIHEIVEKEKK